MRDDRKGLHMTRAVRVGLIADWNAANIGMCTSGYLEGPCPDKGSGPANILEWVCALSHRLV